MNYYPITSDHVFLYVKEIKFQINIENHIN